jgi:exopolyphosphatase / guanosine-5'-triphosphate,3'-diphosphate pyrophosphatase
MRVAVIDLGTNTFNLLIADIDESKNYKIIFKEELNVKLGEGSINRKIISPAPFQRGIEAMRHHKTTIDSNGVDIIKAFATSAMRGATNGMDFVKKTFEETGINIQIIPGEEEANFIYKGVKLAGLLNDEPSLIMDIGGGSTEFIIADNNDILWKHSFNLGAARLDQHFNFSDPITNKQIQELCIYLDKELQPLFEETKKYPIKRLIGCSGSFESFASMIMHQYFLPEHSVNSISETIDLNHFAELHKMLILSTETERYNIKGLVAMRVDTIVLASIFVKYIIEKLFVKELIVSHYALKEGVLFNIISHD